MRAVLRRAAGPEADAEGRMRLGPVVLDVPHHEVKVAETPVELTPREFELLKVLLSQPGRVVTAGGCSARSGARPTRTRATTSRLRLASAPKARRRRSVRRRGRSSSLPSPEWATESSPSRVAAAAAGRSSTVGPGRSSVVCTSRSLWRPRLENAYPRRVGRSLEWPGPSGLGLGRGRFLA